MIYFHRSDQKVSRDLEKDPTIVFSDILYWQEVTICAITLRNPYILIGYKLEKRKNICIYMYT